MMNSIPKYFFGYKAVPFNVLKKELNNIEVNKKVWKAVSIHFETMGLNEKVSQEFLEKHFQKEIIDQIFKSSLEKQDFVYRFFNKNSLDGSVDLVKLLSTPGTPDLEGIIDQKTEAPQLIAKIFKDKDRDKSCCLINLGSGNCEDSFKLIPVFESEGIRLNEVVSCDSDHSAILKGEKTLKENCLDEKLDKTYFSFQVKNLLKELPEIKDQNIPKIIVAFRLIPVMSIEEMTSFFKLLTIAVSESDVMCISYAIKDKHLYELQKEKMPDAGLESKETDISETFFQKSTNNIVQTYFNTKEDFNTFISQFKLEVVESKTYEEKYTYMGQFETTQTTEVAYLKKMF